MKIAITCDWLITWGGAERVLLNFKEIFLQSDIYTSIYYPAKLPYEFKKLKIFTSFLQKVPYSFKMHRELIFLMPFAFKNFNLEKYDLVISSCHAFSKGIVKKNAYHICYCYTPIRYVWYLKQTYGEEIPEGKKIILKLFNIILKKIDLKFAKNVDKFIAISSEVQQRIKKIYNKDSLVLYPAVDINFFKPDLKPSKENYFLVVSRLVPYKKVDLIIKVFSKTNLNLKIIGDGPELNNLKKIASANIEFIGSVNEFQLADFYRKARAVIFAAHEDFGLVPVEAQSCGTPVIAYGIGGAKETVIDGKTGILFYKQDEQQLKLAIKKFLDLEKFFLTDNLIQNAKIFSKENFKNNLLEILKNLNFTDL